MDLLKMYLGIYGSLVFVVVLYTIIKNELETKRTKKGGLKGRKLLYNNEEELTFLEFGVDAEEYAGSYTIIIAEKADGQVVRIGDFDTVKFIK